MSEFALYNEKQICSPVAAVRINVAQQLKQSVGYAHRYQISEREPFLEGEVRLLRTNRSILATARLRTKVRSECSRCLEEFESPLTVDFEEEYFPSKDVLSGSSLPVPEGVEGFIIDENHMLDLTEAIRQHIMLALPMKPLCRQDCAGLCPVCGQNLNYGACNCAQRHLDSRWAPLQGLLSNKRRGR
jgi:uncharacterized protein